MMNYFMSAILVFIIIFILFLVRVLVRDYFIFNKILISFTIILFTFAVVIYPGESYKAAFDGLYTWFNIVCPSLLPFFIGSELLINFGIVNFIGILLEPLMRPIFNVPGCGSFPFIMSITSGYPVGSKIVSQLYNKKLCNKSEAQRLLSFCSTSGPLFIIGAVSIGMLNLDEGGSIILMSHYLGALIVGVLFRFYKYKDKTPIVKNNDIIKRAFKSLIDSLRSEKRPFGLLLSQSVSNSINSILIIGGFIILFSVIIRLLILSGLINIISNILSLGLLPIGVDRELLEPITSGLFEITIGSKLISSTGALLTQKILAICGIISWSGFSIHAQVASMISNTDLSIRIYIFSKFLHTIFSCIISYIIISIFGIPEIIKIFQVFSYNQQIINKQVGWYSMLIISSERFLCIILFLIAISFIYIMISKLYYWIKH